MNSPNEKLTPVYIEDELVWVGLPEYYVMLGKMAIGNTNEKEL